MVMNFDPDVLSYSPYFIPNR